MSLLVLVSLILYLVSSQNTPDCKGLPNSNPLITDTGSLIAQVENGKLYEITGNGAISPALSILHIYGTDYDMGVAAGQLLKNKLPLMLNQTYEYLDSQIEEYLKFLSPEEAAIVSQDGIVALLDLVYELGKPYIPYRYINLMQGIADGSGINYTDIVRVNMIPEAIKASCSIVGAWGTAITDDFSLLQLRALDWSTDGPWQRYPLVMVYHPYGNNDGAHPFATLGWIGMIGALTGYGAADIGICEKVWLAYNGTDSRLGQPWTFVLQDILWYDKTKEDAINRIENSHRTCSIWVGIGDSTTKQVDVLGYGYEYVNVYNATTFPVYQPGHPYIKDVIYVNKHKQPSNDPCLAELLNSTNGIDSEYMWKYVAAVSQTGDMHAAVYDYKNRLMFVANAGIYDEKTKIAQPAYVRPFVKLNMTELFNEIM
eukprot:368860_1